MVRELKRRFNELSRVIKETVVDRDCFGLEDENILMMKMTPAPRKAFKFVRSADKVAAFKKWLQQQINKELIQVADAEQVGQGVEGAWTNKYIYDSYKRGLMRSRDEMKLSGMDIPAVETTGGIDIAMSNPFHLDRVGLLYSRVYSALKGITDSMDSMISQILAQGMADGDNPRLLARKIVSAIDGSGAGTLGITDRLGRFIPARRRAEIMARTEIIRAHHQATIQEYRNWGVAGVKVVAEFRTAGDDRVCKQCEQLDKNIYSLDEIEDKIPVHPQCRCIAIPLSVRERREKIKAKRPDLLPKEGG